MMYVVVFVLKIMFFRICPWLLKEWKELVKMPVYESLPYKICVVDLKLNEIYYHNKCWAKLKRDAEAYKTHMESDNLTESALKFRQKKLYEKGILECFRYIV